MRSNSAIGFAVVDDGGGAGEKSERDVARLPAARTLEAGCWSDGDNVVGDRLGHSQARALLLGSPELTQGGGCIPPEQPENAESFGRRWPDLLDRDQLLGHKRQVGKKVAFFDLAIAAGAKTTVCAATVL